jgi:hypothetical protein
MVQLKGIVFAGAFTFAGSFAVWYAIKLVLGVRVSPEEEDEGLDIGEHGMHAYDIPLFGGGASSSKAAYASAPTGALSPSREHS